MRFGLRDFKSLAPSPRFSCLNSSGWHLCRTNLARKLSNSKTTSGTKNMKHAETCPIIAELSSVAYTLLPLDQFAAFLGRNNIFAFSQGKPRRLRTTRNAFWARFWVHFLGHVAIKLGKNDILGQNVGYNWSKASQKGQVWCMWVPRPQKQPKSLQTRKTYRDHNWPLHIDWPQLGQPSLLSQSSPDPNTSDNYCDTPPISIAMLLQKYALVLA